MTALDFIMLVVLGGGAMLGFMRGFVQETLTLLAWVFAVIMVRMFLAPISDLVTVWLGIKMGASIVAFVLVFGISLLAAKMLARRIGQSSRNSALGSIDRVLGMGFGALQGLVVATIAFLGFSLFYNMLYGAGTERPEWMRSARSYTLLDASGRAMSSFASEAEAMEWLGKPSSKDEPAGNSVEGRSDKDPG